MSAKAKGKMEQLKGKAKETMGKAKDRALGIDDSLRGR